MKWRSNNLLALLALSLAGCEKADAPEPLLEEAEQSVQMQDAAKSSQLHANWAGRWTGVEGMFLEIETLADGGYQLEMQHDLDRRGTYAGVDSSNGIAFQRDGEALLLQPATGTETGLKYLTEKQDCLMVKSGEGYCRD